MLKKSGDMGIRDIQAFNLALLAKQAWRLIHNTHTLFYRFYKSRYFPNCFFYGCSTMDLADFVGSEGYHH